MAETTHITSRSNMLFIALGVVVGIIALGVGLYVVTHRTQNDGPVFVNQSSNWLDVLCPDDLDTDDFRLYRCTVDGSSTYVLTNAAGTSVAWYDDNLTAQSCTSDGQSDTACSTALDDCVEITSYCRTDAAFAGFEPVLVSDLVSANYDYGTYVVSGKVVRIAECDECTSSADFSCGSCDGRFAIIDNGVADPAVLMIDETGATVISDGKYYSFGISVPGPIIPLDTIAHTLASGVSVTHAVPWLEEVGE